MEIVDERCTDVERPDDEGRRAQSNQSIVLTCSTTLFTFALHRTDDENQSRTTASTVLVVLE